ncbi:MAG: hypothetical protein RMZ43_035170 [Nostoc sp. CmiVER01]|uniref:hypothetical protein n=1 Tax=Nostoc sp. CmiVER01 TaxID=3075384 RepID=UPI003D161C75
MDTYINFEGNITEETSYDLEQLANLIEQDCDVSVKLEKQLIRPGVKDSGLTIGLTIAGLAVSAVQTLIAVISYWESKQNKYSLSISLANKTIIIDNLKQEETEQILSEIVKLPSNVTEKIEIKVTRK